LFPKEPWIAYDGCLAFKKRFLGPFFMKNSRNLQAYGLVALVSALVLWSAPQRMASAQNKPAGRTYQIFPGITFPNFPGTRQTPGPTTTPPAKPVIPLVEVPTPGLQKARNISSSPVRTNNKRRRTITEQQAPTEKPRTRRPRRSTPQAAR
jgi:hypothetical protein